MDTPVSEASAAAGAASQTPLHKQQQSAQDLQRAEHVVAEGFGGSEQTEMDRWMRKFEEICDDELEKQMKVESGEGYHRTTTFGFLDLAPFVRNGIEAITQDSFTQCFESKQRAHWNSSFYLVPLYVLGVLLRYFVLFPIRILIVIAGMLMFALLFLVALPTTGATKKRIQGFAVTMLANAFLWSWCAVITEHGVPPPRKPGQIYVANHTSVIDVVLLLKRQTYSLTGQGHTGVIGFFQNHVLASLNCLWFDRLAGKDRHLVAEKIKEHCRDTTKPPLLVFPEGTCVNNEYVIMFKRGSFDLGTCIVPVAIKYNKVFVDAFWNSKKQTFIQHLYTLMTSWAVVADIWYMDPQYKMPGESSTAFAERVKTMIAKQANLTSVPWDGYLKYFKPKKEMLEGRQKMYAKLLNNRFSDTLKTPLEANSPLVRRKEDIMSLEQKAEEELKAAAKRTTLRARVGTAANGNKTVVQKLD